MFFVDLNYSSISELCDSISLGNRGYIYIIDAEGNLIYHPQQQLLYSGLKQERIEEVLHTKETSFLTEDGKLYCVSKSSDTGWTVVGVAYTADLLKNSAEATKIYFISATFILLAALTLAIFLSSAITKPIKQLSDSMREVEKGNFDHVMLEVHGENEISRLNTNFNLMTAEIKHLMEAKLHFRDYNPKQMRLFPERLDKDIDENDPVRVVDAVVDGLKISIFGDLYSDLGRDAYHPKMMMKALVYGYMNNLYSCRKIETALKRDVHFIWLADYEQPDFNTINRFRERMKDKISEVFTLLVLELVEKGFISLDVEYIDGTKIESKANKYTFVWRKSTETNKVKLIKKIEILLEQIDDAIAQENAEQENAGSFSPDDLRKMSEKLNESMLEKKEQGLCILRQKLSTAEKTLWKWNMMKSLRSSETATHTQRQTTARRSCE